ncbi:MAG: twin transmembrane helix small protein [Gammaproteobacteria bacterium]
MLPDFIIILILLLIVASLFSGMFYMLHDRGQSTRAVKALSVRIALSLLLFFLLLLGYWTGILHPHGLLPNR